MPDCWCMFSAMFVLTDRPKRLRYLLIITAINIKIANLNFILWNEFSEFGFSPSSDVSELSNAL